MSGNQQWSGKCVCPGRTCEDKSGGRDRIAGQMSVATKKKRRWGIVSWTNWGDSDLSLLPYSLEKEKLVRELV